MPKKKFHIFFLKTYLPYIIFSKQFCIEILFCKHYFSPLNTFMRKGKVPDPEPDPYLWLMDPDPGGPKTCGSCGSESPTRFQISLRWSELNGSFFSYRILAHFSFKIANSVEKAFVFGSASKPKANPDPHQCQISGAVRISSKLNHGLCKRPERRSGGSK